MQQKIVCFETLGCRLNKSETEGAARYFREAGFTCTFGPLDKDFRDALCVVLCVVNTCTVTARADKSSIYKLRALARRYPYVPVLATGCICDLEQRLSAELKPRVVVLPPAKKWLLKEIAHQLGQGELSAADGSVDTAALRAFIQCSSSPTAGGATANEGASTQGNESHLPLQQTADEHFLLYTTHFETTSRASLKIQDGCDRECTFCAIRLARGKSTSLAPEEALRRTKQIEEAGYAEVVLTGVNLSLYSGKNEERVLHLGELLEYLINNTTKIKFRLSSLYPEQITEEFCRVLQHPRVQPFFHLSVQSLCDSVLAAMGRSYRKQDVIDAVSRLRQCKDNPFISCDMMVVFPTETTPDFRETQQACQDLRFAWIHVFPFSPREGTSAKDLAKTKLMTKKTRTSWLWNIACEGKVSYIRTCKDRVVDAIIEKPLVGVDGGEKTTWRALTDNYLHAVFQCDRELARGEVVRLKIADPLEKNIQDGREEECLAQLVD